MGRTKTKTKKTLRVRRPLSSADRAIAAYRAREAELKAAPEPPPAEAEVVTAEVPT